MKAMDNRFKNASVLMAGFSCLVVVVNHLINTATTGLESPVPGFYHLAGMAYFVLCLWTGMTLRQWLRNPRWWVQALVGALAVFCLYKYRHLLYFYWESYSFLYLALIGLGYLVPERMTLPAGRSRGWGYLALLLVTLFCYVSSSVVMNRLQWLAGSLLPEHHDMLTLMLTLVRNAEPLMVVLALYFVVLFAFSKAGQWVGGRSWFRGIVLVPAVLTFIGTLGEMLAWSRLFSTHTFHFLVQPITVCLPALLVRLKGRLLHRKDR